MGDYDFAVQGTIMRSVRAKPPSHYRLEIQSFASVSKSLGKAGCIESPEFTAAGQTWTMSVYLQGYGERNQGFLSMYLNKVNKKKAQVTIRFFIYDYVRDQYLIIQDSSVKEYGSLKTTFGIATALGLDHFKEVHNGFVKNDCCSFGVEVLEHVPVDSPGSSLAPYKVDNEIKKSRTLTQRYSDFDDPTRSDPFTLLGREWRIEIYPKGNATAKGKCLSMYLYLDYATDLVSGNKLFAEYELCVKNPDPDKNIRRTNTSWYERNETTSSGIADMIPLEKLVDTSEGYLKKKCLDLKVTIKNLFVFKSLHE